MRLGHAMGDLFRRVPSVYWTATGLVAAAFVAYAICYRPIVFPLDDAYITLHNALVLRGFPELSYPGVPALIGSTSVVHTALVTLLTFLFSPIWSLEVSLWVAILAYVLGLTALARARQMDKWLQIIFVILGVIVAQMPHHFLNGLETGLAVAAVTWALVFALTEFHPALAFLCGVLPFIRPELALLSLLLLARQGLKRFAAQTKKAAVMGCSRDLLCALAGTIPWLLLLFLDTGSVIPSTVAAKQAFFAQARLPWSVHWGLSTNAIIGFAGDAGLLSVCCLFLVVDSIGLAGALTTVGIVLAYYLRFPGALNHYERRYLCILLPFFLYAAAAVWNLAGIRARRAVAIGLVFATASSAWFGYRNWQSHLTYCRFTLEQLDGVARFCNAHLPRGSKLLIHDAGYISYATEFRLIDFVGLKTPQAVPLHNALTFPSAGSRRSDAIDRLALAERPDYLVVLETWDKGFRITDGMRQRGWQLEPLRPPDPYPAYQVYRLRPPGSPAAGSAVAAKN